MLASLAIATPPLGPPTIRTAVPRMRVLLDGRIALPSPWVAYELPWHQVTRVRAARFADALDGLGIAVAGLQNELSPDEPNEPSPRLTICPYRGDRYGLELADLRKAKIVDLRLAHTRGADGLPTYDAEQMRRWDRRTNRTQHSDAAPFGSMNAVCWPPDVASRTKLSGKVSQLRSLAPEAIVCVSIGPDHLQEDLPLIMDSGAQMVALRMENWPAHYADLFARRIASTRDLLERSQTDKLALMVIPPASIDVEDYVKILALGADLVAVDGLCISAMREPKRDVSVADWAAVTLGVATAPVLEPEPEIDLAMLAENLQSLRSVVELTGVGSVTDLQRKHLVSFGLALPGVSVEA